MKQQVCRLYTIGHSNHDIGTFLQLVQKYSINVVVDVRTHPYSRYAKQFDSSTLRTTLKSVGVKYIYLGKELGGKPISDNYYDEEGYVRYDLIARSGEFRNGLMQLESGLRKHRVAAMCSEEDPRQCHRRRLIGRALSQKEEILIAHIRGDGRLQSEEEIVADESTLGKQGKQLVLLDVPREESWRSSKPTRSASQNAERQNSSMY